MGEGVARETSYKAIGRIWAKRNGGENRGKDKGNLNAKLGIC